MTLSLGVPFDNDTITSSTHSAPRAGFLLAVTRDGKTLLKGGVGLFYDRVPLMVAAFPDLPDRTVTMVGQNGPANSSVYYQNEIGGELRIPRSTSWSLELDRQIFAGLSLRAAYEQRNTANDFAVSPLSAGTTGVLRVSNNGRDSYREFQLAVRYKIRQSVLNASYVRSRAFGDLNDFNQFFGNLAQSVIQPDTRGRLPFDAPNRFLFWGTVAGPLKLTLVPVFDLHTGFPYSVENEFREYVGPRNVARFPRFSSFDLQITRHLTLPLGEKHLHARVGMGSSISSIASTRGTCRTTLRVPGSGSSSTRPGANTAENLSWSFRNEKPLTDLCFLPDAGTPCRGSGFGDNAGRRGNCDPDDGS